MISRSFSIGAGAFAGALTFGVAGMIAGEVYENIRGYDPIDETATLDDLTNSIIEEKSQGNGAECKALIAVTGGAKDVISRYVTVQCNEDNVITNYSTFESEVDPVRTTDSFPIGSVIIGSVVGSLAVIKFTEDRE